MSDLSVTAANVAALASSINRTDDVVAGAAVTPGQTIYKDTSVNRWLPAQNDVSVIAAGSSGIAIALNGASGDGQPLKIMYSGNINVGATLVVGESYYVGTNAGGICPVADIGSTDWVTFLGIATSTSNLRLQPLVSSTQRAA